MNISANDRILIIAAHPDDEVLGCGGTIRMIADKYGEEVKIYCLILSEPLASRTSNAVSYDKKDFQAVINDSLRASEMLGIQHTYFENLPNNRLDSLDLLEVIKIIESYVSELAPTIVFTHHHGDLNLAHRITNQAALTACRPLEGCTVNAIYSFEIPSSTEWNFPTHSSVFSPNVFVEIGNTIDTKIQAMDCYKSERRAYPHPRSPESLKAIACRWGGVANLNSAEAFEVVYERLVIA